MRRLRLLSFSSSSLISLSSSDSGCSPVESPPIPSTASSSTLSWIHWGDKLHFVVSGALSATLVAALTLRAPLLHTTTRHHGTGIQRGGGGEPPLRLEECHTGGDLRDLIEIYPVLLAPCSTGLRVRARSLKIEFVPVTVLCQTTSKAFVRMK